MGEHKEEKALRRDATGIFCNNCAAVNRRNFSAAHGVAG